MNDELIIRQASIEDADAISELVTDLTLEFIAPELTDEGRSNLLSHQTTDAIRGVIERGTTYWVGEVGGALVGVVAFVQSEERTHLYHLFVSANHQRRGIGCRLWEHVTSHCETQGKAVSITVNSSTSAQPFYRSLGFVEAGPRTDEHGVICHPMRIELHSAE